MSDKRPNVVLVITDDQGYGDLGCTGHPWLKTPRIDAFHDDAVRLTDFHVSPLCTPTRGALMTGRRPVRNGAWATCWGRSILRKSETTMADVFGAAGYRTAMFGKWHLGDNYPYRPQDRGFQHVVAHKGGGVGQTPDFWGNNYFDDTYFHNGAPVEHVGYCTDVWFDEAIRFIEGCADGQSVSGEAGSDAPFFVYLSTNAPHTPYLVSEEYARPYRGNPEVPEPEFCGMIANIDENFGRLRRRLAELGLEEDTVLVFMTDNGSSGGSELDENQHVVRGYNAGMRGKKGSYYDGGHRVPFFLRWPGGGLDGGRDVDEMSLHIDVLPTFIDLCDLDAPDVNFDGRSLARLLHGGQASLPGDRVHFLQYRQDTVPPEKWTNAVMTRRWRLVRGEELYDIKADPGQRKDVAADLPGVVERLRGAYDAWWDEISSGFEAYCPITLGDPAENPARLCAMDVLGDVAWHQTHIAQARKSTGTWAVEIEQPGRYRFSLRRWPAERDLAIDGTIPHEEARTLIYAPEDARSGEIRPVEARLSLFDEERSEPLESGDKTAEFTLAVCSTGTTLLHASLIDENGDIQGAYYVDVERLDEAE
ncbi:MAG: arylsulfatase [Gemmatimonadetes bacterium]|nr:arylsulfatase [Gemmatimonadota bacterium]